jgi:hypothetical protein
VAGVTEVSRRRAQESSRPQGSTDSPVGPKSPFGASRGTGEAGEAAGAKVDVV